MKTDIMKSRPCGFFTLLSLVQVLFLLENKAVQAAGPTAPPPPPAAAIERHDAPVLRPNPMASPKAAPPPGELRDDDATPIGVDVKAIILSAVAPDPFIATEPEAQTPILFSDFKPLEPETLKKKLKPFLGKPLSPKILADLRKTVTAHYTGLGHPFVFVSLPPQNIKKGVVYLQITLFYLGKTQVQIVTPNSQTKPEEIESQIRQKIGDNIDAPKLDEDIAWLNHSPLRQVAPSFHPGERFSETDMDIIVQQNKPWELYGGYDHSGSHSTGFDRYYVGGYAGNILKPGTLLSYQMTSSGDIFHTGGYPIDPGISTHYLAHSLSLSTPLAPRQDLSVNVNFVRSNSFPDTTSPFAVTANFEELSATYRTALSNVSNLPGTLSLGLEAKGELNLTYFGPVAKENFYAKSKANIFQGFIGWSKDWSSDTQSHSLMITVHDNPGGQGLANGSQFYFISNGHTDFSHYLYTQVSYSGNYLLPGKLLRLNTQVSAQISNHPLLSTEQIAIGGTGGVRGYDYDDGSYDNALVVRNELRPAISFSPLGKLLETQDSLSPYLFLDAARAWSLGHQPQQSALSTGVGFDYSVTKYINIRSHADLDLKDAPYSKCGRLKGFTGITAVF